MSSFVLRGWDGLLAALRWSSMAVLAFMMLTVCYDATMRYVFTAPTSWSLEINSFLIVYLAVIAAAEAQRHDAHIRITFFQNKLPTRFQALIAIATGLLGALFCAILVWRGGLLALQAFEYGERVSSAFGTPMVLPYALIPVGFTALGLQFLVDALSAGYRLIHPANEEDSSHG
ncbi:TRAP transporter small permease subunit [Halomonas sp. M20]|uniref:TRAP transporter small permease subunit n=1 Tax=Halomonas sp. M20 TaxID=2763264 RepID=UPI001D09B3AB|nr:TRAP transporter small permease [Halomonas sp. M20]